MPIPNQVQADGNRQVVYLRPDQREGHESPAVTVNFGSTGIRESAEMPGTVAQYLPAMFLFGGLLAGPLTVGFCMILYFRQVDRTAGPAYSNEFLFFANQLARLGSVQPELAGPVPSGVRREPPPTARHESFATNTTAGPRKEAPSSRGEVESSVGSDALQSIFQENLRVRTKLEELAN